MANIFELTFGYYLEDWSCWIWKVLWFIKLVTNAIPTHTRCLKKYTCLRKTNYVSFTSLQLTFPEVIYYGIYW